MCTGACADYGPDADHYGKPICVSANENHLDIVDMSIPFSPKSISKLYGCGGAARTKAPEPFPPVECDPTVECPPGGPCKNCTARCKSNLVLQSCHDVAYALVLCCGSQGSRRTLTRAG